MVETFTCVTLVYRPWPSNALGLEADTLKWDPFSEGPRLEAKLGYIYSL